MSRFDPPRFPFAVPAFIFFACLLFSGWRITVAQEVSPALLEEAARRSGLSQEELLRRYRQEQRRAGGAGLDTLGAQEPGRVDLIGIDDSQPTAGRMVSPAPLVILPFDLEAARERAAKADTVAGLPVDPEGTASFFGAEFFRLDPGVFNPSTFGPVPEDYLIGVGDQIVVDVWGEVEFRLERIVDRDGSIILPKGGKISCHNRTLAQVRSAIRERLARSYSGISAEPGEGTTFVDVSLGRLRAIRVFVVGDAVRPGAYELSSVATVFAALHAAGGPAVSGSMRDVRLMRGGRTMASLDLYSYLLEGKREGDVILREGDTVFIPGRGKTVRLRGAVRRPRLFELREEEGLADLLRFGGGFATDAATEVVHVERILPPGARRAGAPDRIMLDIAMDPHRGLPSDPGQGVLLDGDGVEVGTIADRLENWIEISGSVKRPGRYEYREGLDVAVLIASAGGLWSDTLVERAIVDRLAPDGTYQAIDFALGEVLAGRAPAVGLWPQDRVRIFSKWDIQDRYEVAISGEVRAPGSFTYREGLTLRDLILKAEGLKESADLLKAEVSRLRLDAVRSRDISAPPAELVECITLPLGEGFLTAVESFLLAPHDQVAIRKLPWWELQRTVTVRGEVYYPGVYSLERPDETLSEIITRAGGLKPTAFASGARIVRRKDDVGNIALSLEKALDQPDSQFDVILAAGDEIRVPEMLHTVKVIGEVGFPTSIVYQKGKSLGYYVDRAGGYADGADKWKTRVVYPNGLSRPIKKIWRDPGVMPGSTIVVPVKPPPEGVGKLETLKEIAAIFASVATIYLVIDRTAN